MPPHGTITPARTICLAAPTLTAGLLALALPGPRTWFDEAATVSATSRSWTELWHLTQHQDAPLLGFYALTKFLADCSGLTPLSAGRLVSALAVVLTVSSCTAMSYRLWGSRAAAVSGFAVALLPSASAATLNARPEGLSLFLVCLTYACTGRRWRFGQLLTGLVATLVYALNVLYLPLALLVPGLARRRLTRGDWITTGVSTALGAAWLLRCSAEARQVSWIHTTFVTDLLSATNRVGYFAPLSQQHEQFALGACVVESSLCWLVILTHTMRGRNDAGVVLRLSALWLAPPVLVAFGLLVGQDVFVERYFTPSVLGIALLLGYTCRSLGRRRLETMAVIALVSSFPVLASEHAPDGHWGEDLNRHLAALNQVPLGRVTFTASRDRAVLFADGRNGARLRHERWWLEARREGSLWGPAPSRSQTVTSGNSLVVSDRREARPPGVLVSEDHRFVIIRPAVRASG